MKKRIIIVGGSAGALISAEIFTRSYKEIRFLETYAHGVPEKHVLGKNLADGIDALSRKGTDYFIATGDNRMRKDHVDRIYAATKKLPVNCIHPTAYIAPSATVGYGNLICPMSVIHQGAVIGNGTIINTASVIEHTCVIHDYAQVSPNVTLCGYVEVGAFAFVSAGSVVIPKVKIGEGSIVAAGAAVTKDVKAFSMYAGVPAVRKKEVT